MTTSRADTPVSGSRRAASTDPEVIFRLTASAARVGRLPRGLCALPSHRDPLPDLLGIRSRHDAQVSLGPETGGPDRSDCFSPSEAQARVFGQQIGTIASDLPQLGNGRVQIVDLATRAVMTADASDPCSQELVSTAHTGSLEHMFVLDGPILSLKFEDEATAACPLSGSASCEDLVDDQCSWPQARSPLMAENLDRESTRSRRYCAHSHRP